FDPIQAKLGFLIDNKFAFLQKSGTVKFCVWNCVKFSSNTKMSINRTIYNNLFRKSSTFALTICVSAFFFERAFDMG
ncbi:hypothetical protein GN156_39025, partial [bacterium LRH843]|nr:hypothetical protein [bacterium LRH843]